MSTYPGTFQKAILVKRKNRFVAEVSLNNAPLDVYVPNTGRLSELALPGAEVLLSPINSKYQYKILYIINRSFPVMIDSTYSNSLFYNLLKQKKVPGLENFSIIKREPEYGNHRFDFLIGNKKEELYIELKSCTLFYEKTGSFPDAVSSRASEHVKALAETGKGKLIFLVLRNDIELFLPNYHTDFGFYETLKKHKNDIDIHAFTVQYDETLNIDSLKEIPAVIPDVTSKGVFLLVLFNAEDIVNSDGEVFEQGYYIYCGSDSNVFKTIGSIRAKNGLRKIFTDEQFSNTKLISDLPVISTSVTVDDLKTELICNGGSYVTFGDKGSTKTGKELIYFKTNPVESSWFWDLILKMRFDNYSR